MESIYEVISRITPPNGTALAEASARWDTLAKPLGSLGVLEDQIAKISALQGEIQPEISRRTLLVFCADNGVVAQGVSQCGSAVTASVAEALAEHRSTVNPMARIAGCKVLPVDMGMFDFPGNIGVENQRVRNGTADISLGPAMLREECLEAMARGAALAGRLAGEGEQMLLIGEMGIGNTTTAAAVAAALLGLSPETAAGRGAGLSDEGMRRKHRAIRHALSVNRPNADDPVDVLTKVGGLDLSGMCGAFLGAAACGVGAVIDGMISAAAALCAFRLCPAAKKAMLASHVSAEPAGEALIRALELQAPIRAGLRLGEGSGAVALLPLLDMAMAVYKSGQTFERLGIEAYTRQD